MMNFTKVRSTVVGVIVAGLLAAGVSSPAFAAPADQVTLDANLQACINQSIGGKTDTQPVTEGELSSLITLSCNSKEIVSLSGLEFATGLERIELARNQISDLSPLSSLTHLRRVQLSNNQISDVSALGALPSLSYVTIGYNQISDISPIATLPSLTVASFDNNQISDISPLTTLTGITNLDIANNQISDISPLATLTNLTFLSLNHNPVADPSPLATLTNLTGLDIADIGISDLSPLTALTRLNSLYLVNNQITDVSPLAELTQLTGLFLTGNQIHDVSALAALTELTDLRLKLNQISNVSPLTALTQLTNFELNDQSVSLGNVQIGVPFPNPLVTVDGSSVAVTGAAECTDASCAALVSSTSGVGLVSNWNTPVTLGSATSTFSGTLTQTVLPAAISVTHTIRFDLQGHGDPIADVTVADGDMLTAPSAPTAAGFVFGGWYSDALLTTPYDFAQPVRADATLYAKWTETVYLPAVNTPAAKPATPPAHSLAVTGSDLASPVAAALLLLLAGSALLALRVRNTRHSTAG